MKAILQRRYQLAELAAATLLALLVVSAQADDTLATRGKQLFMLCQACHATSDQATAKVGPSLWGVYGRQVASNERYSYSPALSQQDFVWEETLLQSWLQQPTQMVPGTKMSFAGINDEKSRAAIIAYLKTLQ
ncbi:cytochrome c family protein [Halioxenophilus sp. WMMB6]|uniref:c-type cytochrome n=1 Tax=Halioxenophilus sp. WMMB6 TaxID=3073815 RepID=UPI00295E20EA|nr:cytochrome c family protein [Halioxenophilus sp. WMMB6]